MPQSGELMTEFAPLSNKVTLINSYKPDLFL
ncbi:hypothetical protein ACJ73_08627 [Blastomyces percursus]|uniref:Uncharacterized protein n=1 Tax=Blastomyces percursus TaxID=1658174 RepID=A0A1J9QU15_9EURO|nr:hypothetical protein ACJ73_08627 [Blastomyces percursus]